MKPDEYLKALAASIAPHTNVQAGYGAEVEFYLDERGEICSPVNSSCTVQMRLMNFPVSPTPNLKED